MAQVVARILRHRRNFNGSYDIVIVGEREFTVETISATAVPDEYGGPTCPQLMAGAQPAAQSVVLKEAKLTRRAQLPAQLLTSLSVSGEVCSACQVNAHACACQVMSRSHPTGRVFPLLLQVLPTVAVRVVIERALAVVLVC